MKKIPAKKLLECAIDAVKTAGEHASNNSNRRRNIVEIFRHDVKLQLDIECQQKAEHVIRKRFPKHSILGEEDSFGKPKTVMSDYEWIVDPIDGTVNFHHGLRSWCSSVAVRFRGEVVAGAVFAPELGELYTASIDTPARLNGKVITVSKVDKLSDSLIMTGLDKNTDSSIPPYAMLKAIAGNVQKARLMGVAALDMCQVACGRAEGYFEAHIYIWDIAAAGLIVRQAGGKSEQIGKIHPRTHRLRFIASNGLIHSKFKKLITSTLNKYSKKKKRKITRR